MTPPRGRTVPSAGRRRGTAPGRNPGASTRQVRLLPADSSGPTHEWRCTSLARRTKTVRVRLGPRAGRRLVQRRTDLTRLLLRTWRNRSTHRLQKPADCGPCEFDPLRPYPGGGPADRRISLARADPPLGPTRCPTLRVVTRSNEPGSRHSASLGSPVTERALAPRIGVRPSATHHREWCNRQHTWL